MSTTPPENIAIFKIDNNAFEDSEDTLKRVTGGTFSVSNTVTDYIGTDVVRDRPLETVHVGSPYGVNCYELPDNNEKIKFFQINSSLLQETNTGPIKRYKVPVRMIGDDDQLDSNPDWEAALLGGTYGNTSYNRIYTESTFDVYGHSYDTYYPKLKKNSLREIDETIDLNSYDINYEYNSYLPQYQNAAQEINERLLPSAYFNHLYYISNDSITTEFNAGTRPELESFVTLGAEAGSTRETLAVNLHIPKDDQLTETPPPYTLQMGVCSDDRDPSGKYKDRSFYLRQYLTGAFLENSLPNTIESYINNKSKTLYYTQGSLDGIIGELQQEDGTSDAIIRRYPMYTRIKFPIHSPNKTADSYTKIINDNNLQEEVLSYIKNSFLGGDSLGAQPSPIQFIRHVSQMEANNTSTSLNLTKTTSNTTNYSIDYMQMLLDIANNPEASETENELFISSILLETAGMLNSRAAFRYTKSIPSQAALEKSIKKVNDSFTASDTYTEIIGSANFVTLQQNIADSALTREPEVIAYRIKKTGGPPVGEARRSDVIQNTLLFNDPDDSLSKDGVDFIFYDTQTKYGEEYTYDIYAYMLVEGIKYRYSDLRIGKHTGQSNYLDVEGSYVADTEYPHCVEFYDGTTGALAEQLLNTETNLIGKFVPYELGDNANADIIYGAWKTTSINDGGFENPGAFLDFMVPEGMEDGETIQDKLLFTKFANQYQVYLGIPLGVLGPSTYSRNTQIKAQHKYMADFNFEIEPTVKIIEVPLASKGIKILDSPPMACDVTPYQRKDDTNIIGFFINKESYAYNPDKMFQTENTNYGLYPSPVTSADAVAKQEYLLANNMSENQIIHNESISPVTSVNIYRIDFRPTSLSDFDGNLAFTKNLNYKEDYNYNYSNCFYEEAIATNKKYYYLFKFINANGISGYVSPIQVAELIDDGGYKYAIFDIMFESELKKANKRQINTDFKKLFQVLPAPRHTTFDTTNIDANKSAFQSLSENELSIGTADDLIWGKKFKFRITSKKTGKKIDINVKYNTPRKI